MSNMNNDICRAARPQAPRNRYRFFRILLGLAWVLYGVSAFAADMTIHLPDPAPVSRRVGRYQCDAAAAKLGLPSGPFSVEYLNGGGNSLAVLPISGKPLIFANVISGSGARYAAREYVWWEASGRSISLSSEIGDKVRTECREIDRK
jgi:membrane-bound inhibitor of C-type lysozyme